MVRRKATSPKNGVRHPLRPRRGRLGLPALAATPALRAPVAFKKTKHILRAAEFLRDLVARDVVRLQHLPGKVMVADLLTKAVARALFASLMDLIRQYAESGVACPST